MSPHYVKRVGAVFGSILFYGNLVGIYGERF